MGMYLMRVALGVGLGLGMQDGGGGLAIPTTPAGLVTQWNALGPLKITHLWPNEGLTPGTLTAFPDVVAGVNATGTATVNASGRVSTTGLSVPAASGLGNIDGTGTVAWGVLHQAQGEAYRPPLSLTGSTASNTVQLVAVPGAGGVGDPTGSVEFRCCFRDSTAQSAIDLGYTQLEPYDNRVGGVATPSLVWAEFANSRQRVTMHQGRCNRHSSRVDTDEYDHGAVLATALGAVGNRAVEFGSTNDTLPRTWNEAGGGPVYAWFRMASATASDVPTSAQVKLISDFCAAYAVTKGWTGYAEDTRDRVEMIGNSITHQNKNATTSLLSLLSSPRGVVVVNHGYDGIKQAGLLLMRPYVNTSKDYSKTTKLERTVWEDTNNVDPTGTLELAMMTAYKDTPAITAIFACTTTNYNRSSGTKETAAAAVRSGYVAAGMTGLIDLNLNPLSDADGTHNVIDASWWNDATHPGPAGQSLLNSHATYGYAAALQPYLN